MEIKTWSDLKVFINQLPEEVLCEKVIWWGDEKGGVINDASQLDEDYVTTDYGIEPLSVQDEPEDGNEQYPVTHPKGTPILYTDL